MFKLGPERFSTAERRDREMFSALGAGLERFSTAERAAAHAILPARAQALWRRRRQARMR